MDWFSSAGAVAFQDVKSPRIRYRAGMTAAATACPRLSTGYRLERLAAAFDRVRDSRDWKAPIRSVIPAEERPVVEQAVLWFTETVAAFETDPREPNRLVVTAMGYRFGPAGQSAGRALPSCGVDR